MKLLGRFDEIELSQKIGVLFILDKIYLKKDLKADDLAEKLEIDTQLVAPVFASLYGHNLKELVNMYRVEYAKKKLKTVS